MPQDRQSFRADWCFVRRGQRPGVWTINGEPAKVSWRPVAVQRMDDTSAYVADPGSSRGTGSLRSARICYTEGEQVRWRSLAAATATERTRP